MSDTRTVADDRAARASKLADVDGPEPGRPGTVEVYVVVAHPDDTTSFVVDVHGSRAAAEAEAADLADAATATSVRGFLVEPGACPVAEGRW